MGADAAVGIAYDRRVSVHMMAQEPTVREALNNPLLQGQGFLPRFLMSSAPSIAGTRFISVDSLKTNAYQSAAVQCFWARCKEIALLESFAGIDGAVKPPVIELTPEAQEVWIDFYNRIESEQNSLGEYGGALKPFASRSGELARRLAAGFALFEGEAVISAKTMTAACEVAGHSLSEWVRYLGSAQPDRQLVQAAALMDWLKAKGWLEFHRDKLGREGPARRNAKLRDGLLAVLLKHHHLLSGDGKQFRINPLCRAESADCAEPQQTQGFASADAVLISAEKTVDGKKSAPISTQSALKGSVNPVLSAQSAQSAHPEPVNSVFADFEEF